MNVKWMSRNLDKLDKGLSNIKINKDGTFTLQPGKYTISTSGTTIQIEVDEEKTGYLGDIISE